MKMRQGFVSNSSSSNFVVLGVAFPKGTITREQFAEAMGFALDDWDNIHNSNVVFSDNWEGTHDGANDFIGVSVCDNEDSGLNSFSADVEETAKKLMPVVEKLKIPEQFRKLRIISGQYPS